MASARFNKLWIPVLNDLLYGDLCKNFFDFHIFFLLIFDHDYIIYIDVTHIAASHTASDDVTN